MSKRLWLFFYGYLIISIKGLTSRRLFSILLKEQIQIWEVKEGDDFLTFSVALGDLKSLYAVAQSINSPLIIEKKIGLPFFLAHIKERSFFFSGLLVVILLLYLLSSFIWFVEIRGLESLSEKEIYHVLAIKGLLPGAYRSSLDLDRIEKTILKEEPMVAWVHIQLIGSMAFVHILEKVAPPKEEGLNLYSHRDAIITKVIPLKGQALVKEGDVVKEGDLLIQGEEGVKARAIVEGRTWYEASGYALKREKLEIPTKNHVSSYSLHVLPGLHVHLFGPQKSPFRNYQLDTDSYLLNLGRNLYLPIEIVRNDYQELLIYYSLRTTTTAMALAKERAMKDILRELQEGVTILRAKSTLQEEGEEGVGVQLILEVMESIVQETKGPTKGGFD